MNAEPEKVFNIPEQQSNLTTDANTPKVTLVKREDYTDAMTQRIAPEEMDYIGNPSASRTFGDIAENLPPEAAAALKKYEEIQSTYPRVTHELIPI